MIKIKSLQYFLWFSTFLLNTSVFAEDSLSEELDHLTELTTRSLADRASHWQCTPTVMYVCTSQGCESHTPAASVLLDFDKQSYSRCEKDNCETYNMTFSASGIYTTVMIPASSGTFIKIVNDGSEYIEVASFHLAAFQNFGFCLPLR